MNENDVKELSAISVAVELTNMDQVNKELDKMLIKFLLCMLDVYKRQVSIMRSSESFITFSPCCLLRKSIQVFWAVLRFVFSALSVRLYAFLDPLRQNMHPYCLGHT